MDVLEAIRHRRSIREYLPTPIPTPTLEKMREALRWGPSAGNFQPWHFIFVTDGELRRRLAQAAMEQAWLATAPVTIVGCGLTGRAYKTMGGQGSSVDIDVAIALDHLTLAATAEELGTCWIGAFNDALIREILGIPDGVKIVALTPLGYPARPELLCPIDESHRKTANDVFSLNRFGTPPPPV